MALSFSIDSLTPILLFALLLLLAIHLFIRPSQLPPVHPFIWGRQSSLSTVRNKNESPVFTSGSSSMGFMARDDTKEKDVTGKLQVGGIEVDIRALAAEIRSAGNGDSVVGVWSGEDEESVAEIVVSIASILAETHIFSFPKTSIPSSNNVPSLSLLFVTSSTFEKAAKFLQHVPNKPPVVWLGKGADEGLEKYNGQGGIRIRRGSDLISTGKDKSCSGALSPNSHKIFKTTRSDDGQNHKLTHKAFSTAVTAITALFPASQIAASNSQLNPQDRILITLKSSPFALAAVFAGLHAGAHVLVDGSSSPDLLALNKSFKPTILISETGYLDHFAQILEKATTIDHPKMIGRALKTKIGYAREGVVLKDSWADSWVFNETREKSGISDIRCILSCGGQISLRMLDLLRCIVGVPVISLLYHPSIPIPLFATQAFDMQVHSPKGGNDKMHFGAPTVGVEAKLVNVSEDDIAKGLYRGDLLVKSEGVEVVSQPTAEEYEYVDLAPTNHSQPPPQDWISTDWKAELRRNGTVQLLNGL